MILEPSTTSGEISSSAVISASPCLLCSVDILPPASSNAVLKIYDNASAASGTILWEGQVNTALNSLNIQFAMPIRALKGVYASLTGTTTCVVRYYPTF